MASSMILTTIEARKQILCFGMRITIQAFHNMVTPYFFAESVRAVLEVKTTWKADNLTDIKEKCRKISNLRVVPEPTVLDEVAYMKEVIKSILTGNPVPIYTLDAPSIGMAAIIFNG